MVFASLFRESSGCYLWVCPGNREAEKTADNLRFFLPEDQQDRVLVIPASDADPYRGLSPHPEISETRALGLWRLLKDFNGLVVTSVTSLATRVPSPANFLSHCIQLEVGSFIPLQHLVGSLREMGYVREDPVNEMGEFSYRGGIIDIFSPSRPNPVRVEFFGDEIESIREFDPATQRSIELVPVCQIVPMREIVVTERDIARWHDQAPLHWSEVRFAEALQEKLQFTADRELFNGFEYLFPLVIENGYSLFDYIPSQQVERAIIFPDSDDLMAQFQSLDSRLNQSYEERSAGGELALPPERLFYSKSWLEQRLPEQKIFHIRQLSEDPEAAYQFDFQLERKYQGRIQEVLADLSNWRSGGDQVLFVMPTRGMAERVIDIFKEYEIVIHLAESGFDEGLAHPVSALQGKLSQGFCSPRMGLHVLTEENVFGEKQLRPIPRKRSQGDLAGAFLSDFRDLKDGDFVVHVEHGIGVFKGLKRIGVGSDLREFVELMYREGAKLYIPVDHVGLLQKYSGAGLAQPPIDRLGGASWEKTKSRIRKSMRYLAEDLLKLYARRETAEGHAFQPDDALMEEFEESFEYEETPDQAGAIRDTKKDLEQPRPMDRLICGDVGYGKTEVAMRAAFKVVNDSKQVAMLTPTTVLAFQHFHTFRQRFQGFPATVEMLSRFLSRKEQAEILERVGLGQVDILIGTHRLLSKDVQFRDLGLLVIDEEQRFGVAQKEKLKKLKTRVDVLALSATPIPRTLNMSLIGVRDLSIIETPPKDRLAIQTVVLKFGRNIIRSAIDLELKREGQVFFVHNTIESIYSIAELIQEIIPEARVAVAHGQMAESLLEEVMLDFVEYKYDVLISTTIIENGLDIPRANTLIVNRADRFGLSQLYQLRGRVGRSNRRGYAYLLIPTEETLSIEARKRLAAIKEFSDLGAGFRIAALDLEIRGAGNLLGGEQHGHINAVGFELYMKLLDQTMRELKGEEVIEEIQSNIDLGLDIQIPEHYIDDTNLRLWLYKRVSAAADEQALRNLEEEIVDRFGKYPRSVSNLLGYSRLRQHARRLRILSLDRKGSKILLKFRNDTPVSAQRILKLVQYSKGISLAPEGVVSMDIPPGISSEIFTLLHKLLDEIGQEEAAS
ncbi:MAG: transcription-repair coupling factor [Acidobacteriota bacterium]